MENPICPRRATYVNEAGKMIVNRFTSRVWFGDARRNYDLSLLFNWLEEASNGYKFSCCSLVGYLTGGWVEDDTAAGEQDGEIEKKLVRSVRNDGLFVSGGSGNALALFIH